MLYQAKTIHQILYIWCVSGDVNFQCYVIVYYISDLNRFASEVINSIIWKISK